MRASVVVLVVEGLASVGSRMAGLVRHVRRWVRLVRLWVRLVHLWMWLVSLPMRMALRVGVCQRLRLRLRLWLTWPRRAPSALLLALLRGSTLLAGWAPLLLSLLPVSLGQMHLMIHCSSMLPRWVRSMRVPWGMSCHWPVVKSKITTAFHQVALWELLIVL